MLPSIIGAIGLRARFGCGTILTSMGSTPGAAVGQAARDDPKPSSWASLLHSITAIQKDKIHPTLALRNAFGIALPLVFGLLTGNIPSALIISTGALNVSFSDNYDPYRQRAARMLSASVVVAIAVLVGSVSGGDLVWAVVTASVWALLAGWMVAVGNTPADIGVISLVTVLVFGANPLQPQQAVYASLLAFSGGALQTLFSLALWPVKRYEPERRTLGQLYRELARAAASPFPASEAPPASAQSTAAQQALMAISRDYSVEGERYRLLLSQAERMRLALLALSRLRVRIARENPQAPEAEILTASLGLCSKLLDAVGDSLFAGKAANVNPKYLPEFQALAESMRTASRTTDYLLAALIGDARAQMDALAGQMRSAVELAQSATAAGTDAFRQREASRPWRLRLAGTVATLRANFTLDSAAFRHAIRLSGCVATGDLMSRGFGWRRSYWLPMTIAIVLKPDFTATFSRGVLRLAGTAAGLLLATGLFLLTPVSKGMQVALVALFAFLLRLLGPAHYGILVAAVTALVVFLLGIAGVAPADVIVPRGWNTAVGGAIALVAYSLWPTWERTHVSEALANLLDAYRLYFRSVREAFMEPGESFASKLEQTRTAGRLARSNAEASIDRVAAEPGASAEKISCLHAILSSSHRLAHAMMALEAGLSLSASALPREEFRRLANEVELTLYYLSSALRGSPLRQSNLPNLREMHHALIRSGDPLTARYALINVEMDRITNSTNTLAGDVLRWTGNQRTA